MVARIDHVTILAGLAAVVDGVLRRGDDASRVAVHFLIVDADQLQFQLRNIEQRLGNLEGQLARLARDEERRYTELVNGINQVLAELRKLTRRL